MTADTAPIVRTIEEPVLAPCPSCHGILHRRFQLTGMCRSDDTLLCHTCGWRSAHTARRWPGSTDERVQRSGAPLRDVTAIGGGVEGYRISGDGMEFRLSCGHLVRLQKRAYRFTQKRMRCVQCVQEGKTG